MTPRMLNHSAAREAVANLTIIRITEPELNAARVDDLAPPLLRLVAEEGWRNLRLEFRGLEFLTAAGLGFLLVLHRELRARGASLVLRDVSPRVLEVLEVTGLTEVLPVHPTSP